MKKLYKSRTDAKISGVCGGIAKYLNVDPTLVRLVTLIAVLTAGVGFVAYIACAVIMPYEPEGYNPSHENNPQDVVDYRNQNNNGN